MKYFSMFSGIGGFEYGIEKAFQQEPIREGSVRKCMESNRDIPSDRSRRRKPNKTTGHWLEQWICIGYSEIDKYADAIYKYNFGGKNYGDATKIITGELPDFDLLVGGFPCQAFSIAGKRKGFDDTRGTLFFDIARILADKKPKHFILENVKGLLSHDKGRTFQTIIGVLTDLGYFVEWQVLNSKNFGVPQNRERVFIVGHLGGECGRKVFPIGRNDQETMGTGNLACGALQSRYAQEDRTGGYAIKEKERPKMPYEPGKRKLEYKEYKDVVPNLTSTTHSGDQKNIVMPQIRRLTPIECERLQGFPDNWTKYGKFGDEIKEISDTQRYKCLGNAVTTNVVQAVVERLL